MKNALKANVMSMEEYNSLFGEDMTDVNAGGMEDVFAQGQPMQQKVIDTSVPFIILLTNTSAGAISNVDFLYATESMWDTSTYGVTAGVTPSVGYSNKTYKGFLSQLLIHDLTIGAFLIECSTNAEATATLLFRTDNQRGKAYEDTVIPKILPTWQQTGIAYVEQEVNISAWTKCTLSSIAASAVYKLTMYPYKRSGSFGTEIRYNKPGLMDASRALGK